MHLRSVARSLESRDALAELWLTDKNNTGIAPARIRRCWPFHVAMKPWLHLFPLGARERAALTLFPIWSRWVRRQLPPAFDVAYACMGQASELFDLADRTGALKVVDASSSHPTSFYGFWQRECDLWNPGARVALPRWIFRRCNQDLERADLILCPSTFVRDSMLYNGIPAAKCVINPYGVDTTVFRPRPAVPPQPRFVCVGTLCLRKGHQYLFRAFEKVRKALPDAELICAGSYYPDFARERSRWEGSFTHYEHLPHAELAKILQTATAFVFPSNEEGFARSVIEGMAAGLPIIATHESGATTLVTDGEEGKIVRARDVNHLAEAMIQSATNREENWRMGQAACARVAADNTWDDFAERLLQACHAAREQKRAAAI